eukprot:s767_g16.t1
MAAGVHLGNRGVVPVDVEAQPIDVFDEVLQAVPPERPNGLKDACPPSVPCTGNLAASDWNTAVELDAAVKLNEPETSAEPQQLKDRLAMGWYLATTVVYFVYRSQELSIFTPHAYTVRPIDAIACLLFVGSFLPRSYLIYAINPFRNVVLVALQEMFPLLSETRVNPEYYRNIASASVQLLCGLAILAFTKPQPIGSGKSWALQVPCLDAACCLQHRSRWKKGVACTVNILLLVTAIAATAIALESLTCFPFQAHVRYSGTAARVSLNGTMTTLQGWDHGLKIIFSVLLGISEEVSWREVYMADNNNSLQAFTWGMNHVVAGTGMDNPLVYGLVSGSYAFLLGITDFRSLRYFHHAAVEYFVIEARK